MRAFLFGTSSMVMLLTVSVALPCVGKERGTIITEPPQPHQARHDRTEKDKLRLLASTLVMEGRILERRGQISAALSRYQRAYRLDNDAQPVLKRIVPLALELGRVGVATRYAMLLAETDLDDADRAERLAILLADQLEFEQSLHLYEAALALHRKNGETRRLVAMQFEMGRLYFLRGKHQAAANAFRVVLSALENPEEFKLEDPAKKAILARPELTYTLMAECLLEVEDFERARNLFRKAAQSQQLAGWLPFQLARVDHRAGRHDQALEKLNSYVSRRSSFGGQEPYRLLQELLEKLPAPASSAADQVGDKKSILQQFRDWLANDPENFPLLSFVADLMNRQGLLDEAAILYETSLERQPTLHAYRALITTYRELGDHEKLLNVLGKVTAELQTLGPLADELKTIVGNRELLKRLIELGRQRLAADKAVASGIAAACGFMAIDAQQYLVADEFFQQLEATAGESRLFINWGLELLLVGEKERAAAVFQRAIDGKIKADDEAEFLYYLAGALQLSGQTEEALQAARRAAKLRGEVPAFQIRPAWILYNAGQYAEAEKAYVTWLATFDDNYSIPEVRDTVRDARFVLSNICLVDKRHDEATEWLEQVLDEFPQDIGAMNDLGYLMVDRGLWLHRALTMIRHAVDADPENLAYRDSLGWAFYRLGKYERAIEELQKAAVNEQPDPIILEHLGDALWHAGRKPLAMTTWKRALGQLEKDGSNSGLRISIKTKLQRQVTESE